MIVYWASYATNSLRVLNRMKIPFGVITVGLFAIQVAFIVTRVRETGVVSMLLLQAIVTLVLLVATLGFYIVTAYRLMKLLGNSLTQKQKKLSKVRKCKNLSRSSLL
jgi:hypothetical protein